MNKIRFRLVYNRKKKLNKHGKALIPKFRSILV